MTIRARLLLLFALVLASLLVVGGAYFWAMSRWQQAALDLSLIHLQNTEAEGLRAAMSSQADRARDFLAGDSAAAAEIWRLQETVVRRFGLLRERATREQERGHIDGLEETHVELMWILERSVGPPGAAVLPRDPMAARTRLREIADEVSDDAVVLNQYYRGQVQQRMAHSSDAAQLAGVATGVAVMIALAGVALVWYLTRRWLVQPIEAVNRATASISTGDFSTRVDTGSGEEWQRLAHSINRMAVSLQTLSRQARTRERLAALGEAAAYTAHNLKNPLAGIRMTAQVTLNELPDGREVESESLGEIIAAVDRLDSWARRFLDFARPLELHPAPTDVNDLVARTIRLVSTSPTAQSVRILLESANDLPHVDLDADLMEQALAVLLGNACESGADIVTVATSLRLTDHDDPRLLIAVTDNGCGVATEIKAQLFRAFVTDKAGGTGLGLASARSIVDLHGGQITLASEVDQGTKVSIDLPIGSMRRDHLGTRADTQE